MGIALALSAPIGTHSAKAAQDWFSYANAVSARSMGTGPAAFAGRGPRFARGGSTLQCVPYAREHSGIALVGNALTWWNKAAGAYERGYRPEVGAVLNFRATGRMNLGHVAVVSRVVDSRNMQIDHANWSSRGAISRNISVIDVSANNDWTAVRVALPRGDDYGSVYPTYGFIYGRPDRGVMVANTGVAASPATGADTGPAERVVASLGTNPDIEVAEAAEEPSPAMRRPLLSRGPRTTQRPLLLLQGGQGRPYF